MSWHYQFQLPEGVKPDDPEAAELLAKIKALKPLPPKLTVREQLARQLQNSYEVAAGQEPSTEWDRLSDGIANCYLAEADAAIAFFSQLVRDADTEVRADHPASRDGYVRAAATTALVNILLDWLHQ